MTENRYLVFCWSNYYPEGGLQDLIGRFSSLEEAIAGLHTKQYVSRNRTNLGEPYKTRDKDLPLLEYDWKFDNYQIWDNKSDAIIYAKTDILEVGDDLMDDKYLKHNRV